MSTPPADTRPTSAAATVVITTYNHAPFIAECLDSVLGQRTRHPIDIVVLDDCSTDGTQAILLDYQQRHPERLRLALSEVNRADCAAFAAAVLAAPAPYVAVLDGDDYWTHPDKLQRQIDHLDQHAGCALCFHNVTEVFDDGRQAPRLSNPPDQPRVSQLDDLLESCFVQTCSTLYRHSALPGFPDWYSADRSADWSMAVIAACHGTVDYLDEAMAVYRRHAGGVWSRATRDEQQARVIAFYERMRGYLPGRHGARANMLFARHSYDLAWRLAEAGQHDRATALFAQARAAEPDQRVLAWELRAVPPNRARLAFPAAPADGVRVEIQHAAGATAHDIQLNHPHLEVRARQSYVLRLRARADRPRRVGIGVAQAHEPWQGLGYYRHVDLASDWRSIEDTFVAAATTANARIHLDLGGDDAAVEVSAVDLRPHGTNGRESGRG